MAHCRHRVVDKCKKNGQLCTFEDHCFEPEEEPIRTNADRIRSMSDERLARFLCDFRSCDSSEHPCEGCNAEPYCHTGHMGMIDWLRQPAEED